MVADISRPDPTAPGTTVGVPEKPTIDVLIDLRSNIDEGCCQESAIFDDTYDSGLFPHEDTIARGKGESRLD